MSARKQTSPCVWDRTDEGPARRYPFRGAALRQMLAPYIRPAGMNLTLIRITVRLGMPCAIVAVGAVGLFIVIRHFVRMG